MHDIIKNIRKNIKLTDHKKWDKSAEIEEAFLELQYEDDIEDFLFKLDSVIKYKIREKQHERR